MSASLGLVDAGGARHGSDVKRRILLVVVSLLAIVLPLPALDWKSDEFKFLVTLPTGKEWSLGKPPGPNIRVYAQSSDGLGSVFVAVTPLATPRVQLDDAFISNFERGYFADPSAKKTFGGRVVLEGRPAYLLTSDLSGNGRTLQRSMTLWVEDGYFYQLVGMKIGASPFDDPLIKAFLVSFRFLNPPRAVVPDPASVLGVSPPPTPTPAGTSDIPPPPLKP